MPIDLASGMRVFIIFISALSLLLASMVAADAADVACRTGRPDVQPSRLDKVGLLTSRQIRLAGPIVEGDSARLRERLSELRGTIHAGAEPSATIEFNSNGGDVYEGLNIGYLLRGRR